MLGRSFIAALPEAARCSETRERVIVRETGRANMCTYVVSVVYRQRIFLSSKHEEVCTRHSLHRPCVQECNLTRVFARMHAHAGSQLLDRAKQRYIRRLEQKNQKEV